MVTAVDRIVYYVSDMGRSVRFWRELLGRGPSFFSPGWVRFDIGPVALTLHEGRAVEGGHPHAGGGVVLMCDDLEAECRRLKSAGVPFRFEFHHTGTGDAYAGCLDPDGNEILLVGPVTPPE